MVEVVVDVGIAIEVVVGVGVAIEVVVGVVVVVGVEVVVEVEVEVEVVLAQRPAASAMGLPSVWLHDAPPETESTNHE